MKFVILLIALVGLTVAKQFPLRRVKTNGMKHLRNGLNWAERQEIRLSNKFNMRGPGRIGEIDFDDILYVSDIDLGTPGQTFAVVMDTGSSDFWVPSTECTGAPCKNKAKFDSSKSSTYKKDGRQFQIRYGTGFASGYVAEDNICLEENLCLQNGFGMATRLGPFFTNQPIDGIFGLGFESLSAEKVTPPIQTLINQKKLKNPWFTVWMTQTYKENVTGGQITLGDYDNAHCSQTVDWIPLSKASWYQIKLDAITVGTESSKDQLVVSTASQEAISDTGTSLIAGPQSQVKTIATKLGGKYDQQEGVYIVPCEGSDKLPPIVFSINGKDFPVTAKNYIDKFEAPDNRCFIGIAGGNFGPGGPQWILGDPFIREYCNIYDMGGKRLGLARALK